MQRLTVLFLILFLSACRESVPHYNGYIDADLTYISSNFPGRLDALCIHRGQAVHKNQLLFKLEQTNDHFTVAMSELSGTNLLAEKKELLDQLEYNQLNYRRTLKMRQGDVASQNDLERAKTDLDVSKNKLAAINAQIKSSELNTLDKKWQEQRKEGYAINPGIIYDSYFTPGEYVQAGQPVVSLISKEHIKVLFFIPEQDLSHIALNDRIKISSDGAPQLATGRISYISNTAQYTPPVIYSREERHSLVFRVEARIDHPDLKQLHLGQPITVELVS